MGLRVACDLDGTLADMDDGLQREAENLFGPGVQLHARGKQVEMPAVDDGDQDAGADAASQPQADRQVLSGRQLRQLWAHVGTVENFWTSLSEIEPSSVARLATFVSANRWEVIFFTQRPTTAGETSQLQTQRWPADYGFEYPSVFVIGGARGKAAAALRLHAVLNDRPENCLDVANESKAIPLLVWRDAPELVPQGAARLDIETVHSIAEALDRLQRLGDDRR